MPQNFYPTGIELSVRLVSAGVLNNPPVTPQDFMDFDSACQGAADTWEEMTGFKPFLADTIDSTHYFWPDGSPTVDLAGGFVSITNVMINGNVQTENTAYRTFPQNAIHNGKPITYLKFDPYYGRFIAFYAAYPGQIAPVAVTGKRGAYATLPQLASDAILALAAQNLLGDFEMNKFRGMKSWVIGTDERVYDQQAFVRYAASLQSNIDRALGRYRRIKVA